MATLVLTAVGAAVGGPIGAAIGAIAGQQIDARLFAPKARRGPRLGDLSVQTSSYGNALPKIFGSMRVAGTVIWATDLQEHRSSSGGGKGRPRTVNYSYSASFAVALSGRPIRAVKRIWADGKLLRGAGGDFKSETKYRLHLGTEDQEIDPLIGAAEGIEAVPAYRSVAYAVFEDFQLADYGNHIPSLTFEVEADAAPVPIGAIAAELSGGAVASGPTPALGGYAATGDSVRSAIEALSEVMSLSLVEAEGLRITSDRGAAVEVGKSRTGAVGPGRAGGRGEISRRAAHSLASEVAITYYEPSRDYQSGLQRATRLSPSSRIEHHAFPAALSAETAKGLAEFRLAALWAGRVTAKLHLGWRDIELRPGALVSLEDEAGLWKIERWTLDRMVLNLDLLRVRAGSLPNASAATNPGRSIGQPDLPHGPTVVRLLDLPLYGELALDRPQLLVAAAGTAAGWRRAALTVSYDGGASWQDAGMTAAPAVLGDTLTPLPARGSALFDLEGVVEVELLNGAMWIEGRSDAALTNGGNLAMIGHELVQFGAVEPLGERRFRLSRLLRGRRGTEWAASHEPGEPFVLIERESLAVLEPRLAALGAEARLIATGIGDGEEGVEARCPVSASTMLPPTPVHFRAIGLPGGDLQLRWVRRSRGGWTWVDGIDAPLGEETESYSLTLAGAGFQRRVTVNEPTFLYTASAQAADGAVAPIVVSLVQVGTSGASQPATLIIS
jgi:hypothetical protein